MVVGIFKSRGVSPALELDTCTQLTTLWPRRSTTPFIPFKHTSKLRKNYLKTKEDQQALTVMDFPMGALWEQECQVLSLFMLGQHESSGFAQTCGVHIAWVHAVIHTNIVNFMYISIPYEYLSPTGSSRRIYSALLLFRTQNSLSTLVSKRATKRKKLILLSLMS